MFNPLNTLQAKLEKEIEEEVKRRVGLEMARFKADHERSVRQKEDQLGKILRQLVGIEVSVRLDENRLCYTTSIDDRMLMESLNERDFLRDYLAKEIAYKLMTIQPVTRSRRNFI